MIEKQESFAFAYGFCKEEAFHVIFLFMKFNICDVTVTARTFCPVLQTSHELTSCIKTPVDDKNRKQIKIKNKINLYLQFQ